MVRAKRTTRARQGEGERSDSSKKAQQRPERQPGIGNQAMLRMLSARRRGAQAEAQEPDTAEEKADQFVGRFDSDPIDQSGRTRAELNDMEPAQRDEVMGRVQDKVSQTQFGRIEQITGERGPRSPEAPPKEIKTGEPTEEALAPEQPKEVPAEEAPGAEDKQQGKTQEPEEKKPEDKKKEKDGKEEEQPVEALKKESEAQKEKQAGEKEAPPEDEKTGKAPGAKDSREKARAHTKTADTGKGEKPAAQEESEKSQKDKAKGDEEAKKAARGNQAQEDNKAQQTTARASEPGQDQAAQALSELPAESKGPGAEKPAAPVAPARQAAAQSGPAVVATGVESSGGGGGGGGAEAALDEEAPEESTEKEAEADKAEEKMASAEGGTEPEEEREQEPPEPDLKAETEGDIDRKPSPEDEELIKQAESERQEQTRNPEGAEAAQSAEEEQEPPPAERAELNPAEARAGLESLAEGAGGEPAGGGGGGGAISEQPQPDALKVESLTPVAAMGAVSGLKVGQISKSIAGVQTAVGEKMSGERSDLAANPPSMERPSGAPQTREGPIVFGDSAQGKAKVEETPEGEAVPVEGPEPLPDAGPSPTDQVASPSIQGGGEGGTLSEADAENIDSAVDDVPTSDPALNQTPGPAPTVELVGEADPQQATDQRAALDQSLVEQQTQGAQDVARPMGENEIYPVVPQETLTAKVQGGGGGGATGGAPAVDDETTAIVAEEKQGDEVRASAQQASSDMQAGEEEKAAKTEEEKAAHEAKVKELEEQNATQQADTRGSAAGEVQQLRGKWSQGQQEAVETAHSEANAAQETMSGEVESQRQRGNESAAAEIERGNREAGEIREKAQGDAEQKKAEAKKESSGGILGWIASKAKAFFEGLKKAVHAVFDLARKALKTLIDGVKKLAAAAIDLARNAIIGAIRLAGKALIAVGDIALAAFPGLRDQFRGFIEEKVKAAEDTVNKLADALKEGINKLLDLLASALEGLLNLLEKAYMAAIEFVASAVQTAIKIAQAAIALLGVLAAIIKDVAAGPAKWLANLGAAVIDGIKNHIWKAFKEAVKNWFFSKLEEVVGVGKMIFDVLFKGGIKLAEIGKMAFEGLKAAIPVALIAILVEKLVAMIVPAAGALMVIIEGLQAAWGAVSRILQAIDRFVAFLKAVKSGGAGPKFADAVASAAVVVIDFVASWLIRKIRGPASKIGGKIKAIAKKIMAKLKAAAKKIGGAIKKTFRKIKAKFKKLFKRKKKKTPKKEKRDRDKAKARLDKAVSAIRPQVTKMLGRGVGRAWLTARLMFWRVRYRLSALQIEGNRIVARVNPDAEITAIDPTTELGRALEPILREVEQAYLDQYEQSRMADDLGMSSDKSGPDYIKRNPEIDDILTMRGARSGEQGLRRHEPLQLRSTGVTMTSASQRENFPWWDPNPARLTDFRVPAGREASYDAMREGWKNRGIPSMSELAQSPSLRTLGLLERARGTGMLPAMDLASALGQAGLANAADITFGDMAPMAPVGAAQATEDEARRMLSAQQAAEGQKASETIPGTAPRRDPQQIKSTTDERRKRIGNIFLRLREVLKQPQPIATTPGTASLPALAQAFESWLKARLNPDPDALSSASLGLAQQLLAFLKTYRGG
jgi:hypothetical protein